MSDLIVRTPYRDISDLAQAYAQRVDDSRIMVPSSQVYGDGEWIRFVLLLADGTTALDGQGRVQQTIDNGDAVSPAERYDVVFEQLQWDPRSEVMFERIVLAAQRGGDPPTGEIALDQVGAIEEHAASSELDMDDATVAGEYADAGDVEHVGSQPPPAPARPDTSAAAYARPAGAAAPRPAPAPAPMQGLTRPSRGSQWYPDLPERPDARPSSGYFQYGQGVLPSPQRPPRPDLPEERRIQPAPRPTNGQGRRQDLIPTMQSQVGDSTRQVDAGEYAQEMDLDATAHQIRNPDGDDEES